jgi:hypothetical protein
MSAVFDSHVFGLRLGFALFIRTQIQGFDDQKLQTNKIENYIISEQA